MWRCGGLNPGPFTCKANALPLSYIPDNRDFNYCRFECNGSFESILVIHKFTSHMGEMNHLSNHRVSENYYSSIPFLPSNTEKFLLHYENEFRGYDQHNLREVQVDQMDKKRRNVGFLSWCSPLTLLIGPDFKSNLLDLYVLSFIFAYIHTKLWPTNYLW